MHPLEMLFQGVSVSGVGHPAKHPVNSVSPTSLHPETEKTRPQNAKKPQSLHNPARTPKPRHSKPPKPPYALPAMRRGTMNPAALAAAAGARQAWGCWGRGGRGCKGTRGSGFRSFRLWVCVWFKSSVFRAGGRGGLGIRGSGLDQGTKGLHFGV